MPFSNDAFKSWQQQRSQRSSPFSGWYVSTSAKCACNAWATDVKKNETNKQRKKHSPKLTCRAQLISKRHRTGRCKWKWKQRPMPAVQPGCWSSAGREGTGAPASPLLSACLPGGSPRHEPNPTTTRWLCGLCADENLSAQSDIPVPAVPPEILTPSPLS